MDKVKEEVKAGSDNDERGDMMIGEKDDKKSKEKGEREETPAPGLTMEPIRPTSLKLTTLEVLASAPTPQ